MGVHCGRGVMTITLRLKDARHYDHRQYLTEALLIGRTGYPPLQKLIEDGDTDEILCDVGAPVIHRGGCDEGRSRSTMHRLIPLRMLKRDCINEGPISSTNLQSLVTCQGCCITAVCFCSVAKCC